MNACHFFISFKHLVLSLDMFELVVMVVSEQSAKKFQLYHHSVYIYVCVFVSVHACVSSPIAHMGWSSSVYQIRCVSEQIGNANFTLCRFVSYRSLTLIPPLSSCLNE